MSLHFQSAALVDSPSYPNAVTWSEENLLAVASDHLVTILNPAMVGGPRGLINIPVSSPFPIGVIDRKDLASGCLLPTTLSRGDACVRSISWSPIGLAPNSSCLLAVCTNHGNVKLYRMPFCEFSAEWIEVLDVSDLLLTYLTEVCFEETAIVHYDEQRSQVSDEQKSADDSAIPIRKRSKRRKTNTLSIIETNSDDMEENTSTQTVPLSDSKSRARKKTRDSEFPLITAEQYASRNEMLSSLVVAWSPILHLSPATQGGSAQNTDCSILAVGAKSGKISFWRIRGPKCYSVTNINESIGASLVGLTEAHCSWITTICWAIYVSDASKPQLLLATGSSDGSVKIWQAYTVELLESPEVGRAPFSLLKEITSEDSVPVSALAIIVPVKAPHKLLIAIGKGSGSIEVWNCDIPACVFEKFGTYDAHDHTVTGLAWAFDGNCLYSCSKDNTMRSWNIQGNLLSEAPIPSNTLGVKSSSDVPHVSDSSYGVAFSPGNLVVAVARSFDIGLLNPMYEQRALKAAIEFLWIGGQQLDNSTDVCPDFDIKSFPDFPEKDLVYWESNILGSLNQHEHLDKPLVTWDVVAALSGFKQSIPKYTEHILLKWLASHVGESLSSSKTFLSEVCKSLTKMTTRQLHLVNIITRHVILKELKADKINGKDVEEMTTDEDEESNLWMKLIVNSEMELRLRLVEFSFSTIFSLLSDSSINTRERGYWSPAGLAQMEQWVTLNKRNVKDQIQLLAEDIRKIEKSRLQSICEYVGEERCGFCSALVPFESAEVAFCQGLESGQRHKLARCAVSMKVCPLTPSWYCMSCHRRSSELVPEAFFTTWESAMDNLARTESMKPLCPFCGILLQRSLPDFLLSPSPT